MDSAKSSADARLAELQLASQPTGNMYLQSPRSWQSGAQGAPAAGGLPPIAAITLVWQKSGIVVI
jgi:hypothetical protein